MYDKAGLISGLGVCCELKCKGRCCFVCDLLCLLLCLSLLNLVILFVLLSAGDIILRSWIFLTNLEIEYVYHRKMLTGNAYVSLD